MKINYSLLFTILCVNISISQIMLHSEEELQKIRQNVIETKKLGRDAIIAIAATAVTNDAEGLLQDKYTHISVWSNELGVVVKFKSHTPIKYIPYQSEYYTAIQVSVSKNQAFSSSGSPIASPEDYDSDMFQTTLYQSTPKIEVAIDTVLALNNASDTVNAIDKLTFQGRIIIREHKNYYHVQLGESYSITYKIKKASGKIYDYDDPYGDRFFPTPAMPPHITPAGGEWIEMKE